MTKDEADIIRALDKALDNLTSQRNLAAEEVKRLNTYIDGFNQAMCLVGYTIRSAEAAAFRKANNIPPPDEAAPANHK